MKATCPGTPGIRSHTDNENIHRLGATDSAKVPSVYMLALKHTHPSWCAHSEPPELYIPLHTKLILLGSPHFEEVPKLLGSFAVKGDSPQPSSLLSS